jgi:hypothetical protein
MVVHVAFGGLALGFQPEVQKKTQLWGPGLGIRREVSHERLPTRAATEPEKRADKSADKSGDKNGDNFA